MSCKPFNNKLEAYALGLLNDHEKQVLDQHIQTCQTCQSHLSRLNKANYLIEQAFDQEPPDYLRTKVRANLKDVKPQKTNWLMWTAPGVLSVMVLLLVIKLQPGQLMKNQAIETAQQSGVGDLLAEEKVDKLIKVKASQATNVAKFEKRVEQKQPGREYKRKGIPKQSHAKTSVGGYGTMSSTQIEKKQDMAHQDLEEDLDAIKNGVAVPNRAGSVRRPARKQDDAPSIPVKDSEKQKILPSKEIHSFDQAVGEEGGVKLHKRAEIKRSIKKSSQPYSRRSAAPAPVMMRGEAPMQAEAEQDARCMVRLTEIKGNLDQIRVSQELEKLSYRLNTELEITSQASTANLLVSIDVQGQIKSVVFTESNIKDDRLKKIIISSSYQLRVGKPFDQLPAQITFLIKIN